MDAIHIRLTSILRLTSFVACFEEEQTFNPAQVTSAQFGQTVLLLKLKIS